MIGFKLKIYSTKLVGSVFFKKNLLFIDRYLWHVGLNGSM